MTKSWQIVWRNGFIPGFDIDWLLCLRDAIANDDPRLTQGSTTTPPPLMCVQDWPVEAADAIGYCGVMKNGGFGTAKVGDVEEFFAKACFDADQRLGEPAACRWFINWFDDTPRDEMRRELLKEIEHHCMTVMIDNDELLPPELSAALLEFPEDATLCGAIADWCEERGYYDSAKVYRYEMRALTDASRLSIPKVGSNRSLSDGEASDGVDFRTAGPQGAASAGSEQPKPRR